MAIKKGFSLIELVVVIGLLSLLMLAISSTMLMSIISSNRIRTVSTVKNAGNYALGQLQSMIRSAKSVASCDSTSSTLTIVNPDGASTTFAAIDLGAYTSISSNSGVYITPANIDVTSYSLICEPSDTEPTLVKIAFDLRNKLTNQTIESPGLHFETSINLRNE